jgi:hypothetical protein
MATISDSTATEPAFLVERFAVSGDRVEVAGHWRGVRGRRFVRPVLWLHHGETRQRLVAVLDHKPWAADDGEPWQAAFKWTGGKLDAERAELEVGTELVVDLPLPGGRPAKPRPARPRVPSELERVREQLLSATKERTALQAALDRATTQADELARVRAERDRAREQAERARADGERLVNDEYRQRERALEVAEEAGGRAREAQSARQLAERQLAAAREAHAELERRFEALQAAAASTSERLRAELAEVEDERNRLRAELAEAGDEIARLRDEAEAAGGEIARLRGESAEVERLRGEVESLRGEVERLRAAPDAGTVGRDELARVAAERDRLAGDLAGALGDRDRLSTDVVAARAGRERVEAELVEARGDRKRLERELASLQSERERAAAPRRRVARLAGDSRLAPPESGMALWGVRAVALGLVAILLAAIAFALAGVL